MAGRGEYMILDRPVLAPRRITKKILRRLAFSNRDNLLVRSIQELRSPPAINAGMSLVLSCTILRSDTIAM